MALGSLFFLLFFGEKAYALENVKMAAFLVFAALGVELFGKIGKRNILRAVFEHFGSSGVQANLYNFQNAAKLILATASANTRISRISAMRCLRFFASRPATIGMA